MYSLRDDWNNWWLAASVDSTAQLDPAQISPSTIKSLRNALQVQNHREAPALSSSVQCYENFNLIHIDPYKTVRCYDIQNFQNPNSSFEAYQMGSNLFEGGYLYPYPIRTIDPDGIPISTMRIRSGTTWSGGSGSYPHSRFSVKTLAGVGLDPWQVNVYSSDKAIYLDSTTNNCLTARGDDGCDWDMLFSAPTPDTYKSTSLNPLLTEYTIRNVSAEVGRRWCRSFAYLKFPTYILPTSQIGPESTQKGNVIVEDNVEALSTDEAISIHPDWFLAAWSVDINGTIEFNRPSAQRLFEMSFDFTEPDALRAFSILHQNVVLNGLSIINYHLKNISSSTQLDLNQRVLKVSVSVHVWSYGLDSGTSKLGVVIAIAGCILVLGYVVAVLVSRAMSRSLLDFVLVALEQDPPGVFVGLKGREPRRLAVKIRNAEDWRYETLEKRE